MVLGYLCEDDGYVRECDVDEGGQRICPECGKAVTGLVGQARSVSGSPPTDKSNQMGGDIRWSVRTRDRDFAVHAFDVEGAVEAAIQHVDNPQEIKEVKPSNHQYRN